MSAPSKYPRWADGGIVTEPTEAKKDEGFLAKEKPPAQILNWLLNLIYQWIVWLAGPQPYWVAPTDFAKTGTGDMALFWDTSQLAAYLTYSTNTSVKVGIPLRVKQGSTITSVDVLINPKGVVNTFRLWKQTYDYSNTSNVTVAMTQIGGDTTVSTAGNVIVKVNLNASSTVIDQGTQVFLEWEPAAGVDLAYLIAYRVN